MTSKFDSKPITRRQVDNLRGESMRYASYMLTRLRMSVLGKPAKETCECGKEYELFPNQPIELNNAQVTALKFDVGQVYPGIESEDLDKVTQQYDPIVARDNAIEAIKKFDKNTLDEYEARGVKIIILDKPVLKVVEG